MRAICTPQESVTIYEFGDGLHLFEENLVLFSIRRTLRKLCFRESNMFKIY